MTDRSRVRIEPAPTPEEAAAIVAALEALRTRSEAPPEAPLGRSRWRLAGLLGHPLRGMEPEDPLWSYTRWEDIT